jgi:hypothetical protein
MSVRDGVNALPAALMLHARGAQWNPDQSQRAFNIRRVVDSEAAANSELLDLLEPVHGGHGDFDAPRLLDEFDGSFEG